jgi:hypothetical protein
LTRSVLASLALSAFGGPVVYFAAEAALKGKWLQDGRFSADAADEWFRNSVVTFPAIYLASMILLSATVLAASGARKAIGRRIEECGLGWV